jgi:hypothetical protein
MAECEQPPQNPFIFGINNPSGRYARGPSIFIMESIVLIDRCIAIMHKI